MTARSWRPVRDLCTGLIAQMDVLAPEFTRAIRAEEPAYGVVPLAEHERHVHEQQVRLLQAVADGREPDAGDLERADRLGRRRATQDVPVQAVIGAYHVGNRELWDRMRAQAGPSAPLLSDVAAMMWRSVQLITARLAEAHAEVTNALHADQITLRHRLVALLRPGQLDPEATLIAERLGFDPAGRFIALSLRAVDVGGDGPARLGAVLDLLPGRAVTAQTRDSVVVLAQVPNQPDQVALVDAVARATRAAVAVGLERPTLDGAAESLRDSQRLLATMGSGPAVRHFADHWLAAVLLADTAELRPLVEPQLAAVRANPHLADAVLAFADHDLSATAAARAMGLHPNTTMYRLARWHELTGWDAKTFHGLALSLLACWIARPTGHD